MPGLGGYALHVVLLSVEMPTDKCCGTRCVPSRWMGGCHIKIKWNVECFVSVEFVGRVGS